MTFYLVSEDLAKAMAEHNLKPSVASLAKEENTPHTPRITEHLDNVLASIKDIDSNDPPKP